MIWAGVGLLLSGLVWDVLFANIPYQDPTPQMQANWDMHKAIAERTIAAGALLIITGIGVATFRSIRRRLKPGKLKG